MPTFIKIDLLRADVRNRLGRIYPKRVLDKVIQGNHTRVMTVTSSPLAVEMGDAPAGIDTMVGELNDLQIVGDRLIGVMRVVDNLEGQKLQQLHQLDYRFSYGVIALDRLKAEANGYYTVSVPIHGVAVDCHDGSIIVVDEEQATVIRVIGKVPVSNPAPSRKVLLD